MNLFGKGKGDAAPAAKAPVFSPIDRTGLLGLLDQVVNTGQSGVLELHEPRGNWVYAFQAGALTHASGGRVRGARQAFDLLWEFQAGEYMFTPGVNPALPGNLYIDKGRLLDLLRRSEAVLQGPSAPYIPPGQQRPIAPVSRSYSPPNPNQMPPQWQPGVPAQQWPGTPQAPMPQPPGWPGYPQQPGAYPPAGYPGAPAPGQPYPQAYPGYPQPPLAKPAMPAQPQMPPGMAQPPMPQAAPIPQQPYPQAPYPQPPFAQPPAPQQFAPQPPAAPARPATPPSFSVPPMPIPRKQAPMPTYQPAAAAPPAAPAPAPEAAKSADDLAALRASLVAQAPVVKPAPAGAQWNIRKADGSVAPAATAAAATAGKGKTKDKTRKGDSKMVAALKVQLIKFLLWACERRYSPDDHWTLKDAFEVSTMELRDQFFSAFSQTLKSASKPRAAQDDEDDIDDMTAGRMRGRARRH